MKILRLVPDGPGGVGGLLLNNFGRVLKDFEKLKIQKFGKFDISGSSELQIFQGAGPGGA